MQWFEEGNEGAAAKSKKLGGNSKNVQKKNGKNAEKKAEIYLRLRRLINRFFHIHKNVIKLSNYKLDFLT